MNQLIKLFSFAGAVVALTTGCVGSHLDGGPLGDAKNHVMNAQIDDKDASLNPSPDAVVGIDGVYVERVLTIMREHVTDPSIAIKETPIDNKDPRVTE